MANRSSIPVLLTISGSDPSGGAGLQADLKTFTRHGVYGASAVSLLTVQNTLGVEAVEPVPPALVVDQARAVLDDLPVAVVKTGSLGTAEAIVAVAELLAERDLPLVVDPVLVSKHGHDLAAPEAARAFAERLLPLATIATPNLHEARRLLGDPELDPSSAARRLAASGPRWALVTGGADPGPQVVDRLAGPGGRGRSFAHPKLPGSATHGTGCATSAAVASWLARGASVEQAVERAIAWVTAAIAAAPPIGRGVGPVGFQVEPPRP
jgi:hydroxymethylpyrimidine/phosphomethylpyrimidine kinase